MRREEASFGEVGIDKISNLTTHNVEVASSATASLISAKKGFTILGAYPINVPTTRVFTGITASDTAAAINVTAGAGHAHIGVVVINPK